jgi:hypothetical protein
LILRNRQPIYLKPTSHINPEGGGSSSNQPAQNNNSQSDVSPTQAHTDEDVLKSELHSLRQSAVSMSVSEKAGANQIVKDWLDDKVDDEDDKTTNEE